MEGNSSINNKTDIENTYNITIENNKILEQTTETGFDANILKSKLDIEEFLKDEEEKILMREKLMFETQSVNLLRIYALFLEPIDWLFVILAIIGAIGAGVSIPALFYIGSEVFTSQGNTSETRNIRAPPQIYEMIQKAMKESGRKSMNLQVKRQLIAGAISFVCNFMSGAFWLYIGNKCSYNFKKKYFILILSQEQGWFDSINTYELATKVHVQIEKFEQGIGLQVGLVLSGISQFIGGFIVAFLSAWKLSLIMVCFTPIVIILYIILDKILRKGNIIERKTWEIAGGMAEEIIYNIKTVSSFANFEYELQRFYEKVEIVWKIGLMNTYKLAFFNGIIVFALYFSLFICFIYGRTIVKKEINPNKGRDISGGDIYATGICILIGLGTLGKIAPNINGIQEYCAGVSDYFNLFRRKPQMDLSQTIQKYPISQIQGKIEFHRVNFIYPSDL